MAKEDNKKTDNKKTAAKEKPVKAPAETFKYGVAELADTLGIAPESVRVQLRNKNIAKAGKSYGWNTKDEFQAVVAKLKPEKKAETKPAAKSDKKAKADA